MKVLKARNVHNAFPVALDWIKAYALPRESRAGKVLQFPFPVTTVYENPLERVIFYPERDANPFFHLYESLWMLGGRNDIAPMMKFNKRWIDFSDNGITQHAAYGHRWRKSFGTNTKYNTDQLEVIADLLNKNPEDRRCVLQMWDTERDLAFSGKDVPCNLVATFQRDKIGTLHLVVFCRSNDIIWGCYGANAVHFSILLEYMSILIGCPVGTYTQISVNWHAYQNVFDKMKDLLPYASPYEQLKAVHIFMPKDANLLNVSINEALRLVDTDFETENLTLGMSVWGDTVYRMLLAWHIFKSKEAPEKYTTPIAILDGSIDWIVAGREWMERRYQSWKLKNV